MTPFRVSIAAALAALILLAVIFELIRSRRLQEFSETGTRVRESPGRDLNAERLQLVKDPAGC